MTRKACLSFRIGGYFAYGECSIVLIELSELFSERHRVLLDVFGDEEAETCMDFRDAALHVGTVLERPRLPSDPFDSTRAPKTLIVFGERAAHHQQIIEILRCRKGCGGTIRKLQLLVIGDPYSSRHRLCTEGDERGDDKKRKERVTESHGGLPPML